MCERRGVDSPLPRVDDGLMPLSVPTWNVQWATLNSWANY